MLPYFLTPIENKLQNEIKHGLAPFLSLFVDAIEPATRAAIERFLSASGRSIVDLEFAFISFPALMSSHLTACLANNYGENFQIYTLIGEAFNIRFESDSSRKRLWRSFRKACSSLGLDISPRTSGSRYMVDEYLRQTGLPDKYTSRFTQQCLALGKNVGFPEIDSLESMMIWQDELIRHLNPPFPSTCKKVIVQDNQCYYVQNFLEVMEQRIEKSDFNSFQMLVHRALQERSRGNEICSRKIIIPAMVWQDEVLGISLPSGENILWDVAVDGQSLCEETRGQFICLDSGLPEKVCISRLGSEQSWSFDLWADGKNNRMLLFNSKGVFISRIDFSDRHIPLRPDNYILLSRFDPMIENNPASLVQDDPEIFASEIPLNPGSKTEICKGPGKLILEADSIPLLKFTGQKYTDIEGEELFAEKGLRLAIQSPEFLNSQPLEIKFRVGNSEPVIINIDPKGQTEKLLDIEKSIAAHFPCGVFRMVAECRKAGLRRILARTSALIWNGLRKRDNKGSFICTGMPENLDPAKSVNVRHAGQDAGSGCLISRKNKNKRYWSTAFSDRGRELKFTWGRPGLEIKIRTADQGRIVERIMRPGICVSIEPELSETLILSGMGEGMLSLGEQCWPVKKNQKIWRASLKSLADAVEFFKSKLIFRSVLGVESELLCFVTPVHTDNFKLLKDESWYKISFTLLEAPETISLQAVNIFDGSNSTCSFYLSNSEESEDCFTHGSKVSMSARGADCELLLMAKNFPAGLWILDINACCNGRHGRLGNSRDDRFTLFLAVQDGLFLEQDADGVLKLFESNDVPLSFLLLELNRQLLCCHALQTWKHIAWIKDCWKMLIKKLEQADPDDCALMMQILNEPVPEDAHQGWIPLLHPAWEKPEFLASAAACFQKPIVDGTGLSRILQDLVLLEDPGQALLDHQIDPLVGMGFESPIFPLKNFSIQKFVQACEHCPESNALTARKGESLIPGKGDFLSHAHLNFARNGFWKNWIRGGIGEGNPRRRSWATMLAHKAVHASFISDSALDISPAGLRNFMLLHFQKLEQEQEDVFLGSAMFIFTFAWICRRSVPSPKSVQTRIADYLKVLDNGTMEQGEIEVGAEYLLACGEDLLGFFLMFWEMIFQSR